MNQSAFFNFSPHQSMTSWRFRSSPVGGNTNILIFHLHHPPLKMLRIHYLLDLTQKKLKSHLCPRKDTRGKTCSHSECMDLICFFVFFLSVYLDSAGKTMYQTSQGTATGTRLVLRQRTAWHMCCVAYMQ